MKKVKKRIKRIAKKTLALAMLASGVAGAKASAITEPEFHRNLSRNHYSVKKTKEESDTVAEGVSASGGPSLAPDMAGSLPKEILTEIASYSSKDTQKQLLQTSKIARKAMMDALADTEQKFSSVKSLHRYVTDQLKAAEEGKFLRLNLCLKNEVIDDENKMLLYDVLPHVYTLNLYDIKWRANESILVEISKKSLKIKYLSLDLNIDYDYIVRRSEKRLVRAYSLEGLQAFDHLEFFKLSYKSELLKNQSAKIFSKMPYLKNFHGDQLSDKDLDGIENLKNLQNLILNNSKFSYAFLFKTIAKISSLQHVEFRQFSSMYESSRIDYSQLPSSTQVRSFDMAAPGNAEFLRYVPQLMPQLERLKIVGIAQKELSALANAVEDFQKLSSLHLVMLGLKKFESNWLNHVVRKMKGLRELEMNFPHVQSPGQWFEMLEPGSLSKFEELRITNIFIKDEDLAALVQTTPHLGTLSFNYNPGMSVNGILKLKDVRELNQLVIRQSKLKLEDQQRLAEEMPNIEIVYN